MRDGEPWALGSWEAEASLRDHRGRMVVVVMVAAAVDQKDQRRGVEPDPRRRNLQVCTKVQQRDGVWGGVQGCAGGWWGARHLVRTQQWHAAWSAMFAGELCRTGLGAGVSQLRRCGETIE